MTKKRKPKRKPTTKGKLRTATRGTLVESYQNARELRNKWLKTQIVENGRLDILCQEILGYEYAPHHARMIEFQRGRNKSMVLAFRGSGKSTVGTIARTIHFILRNPNIRILIASRTSSNANDFLREIKTHFEANEKLIEVFGNYVGTNRWDTQAIEVRPRTIAAKEPTVNTLGAESAVVSKHYDIIIVDDLVDLENSRTPAQRDRNEDFFYTTLLPTLEPPEEGNPLVGRMLMYGTRYHPDDTYGRLMKKDMAGNTLIIPDIDEETGEPTWKGKYTLEHLAEMKRNMGTLRYRLQMKCDVAGFQGSIFQYEWMEWFSEMPMGLRIFMGIDLAISQGPRADLFALIVLGVDPLGDVYVIDGVKGRYPFARQIEIIKNKANIYHPIRVGIEANAYQMAMVQELKRLVRKTLSTRFQPVYTTKDKKTRAEMRVPDFESGRMYFNDRTSWVVDDLLEFPDGGKDTFDALDIAMSQAKRRLEPRGEDEEPGLFMIGR
jgi:predicted phage terminase large subunit-like protein